MRSTSGMKSTGRNRRPDGWFQRISASTPTISPVREVDLRLVVQDELVALDALAELAEQGEAARRGLLLLGREQRVAGAGALGVVHREVGAAEQVVDVVAVERDERDADARLHVDDVTVDDEGRLERLLDRPDDARGARQVGGRRRQDPELVAAEPRHRVAVAQAVDRAVR